MDLFSATDSERAAVPGPLADRMRPRSLDELLGQGEVVGSGRPLRLAIEQDTVTSVILWGPPGSGKTSLGHLIALHTKAHFEPFSAVTSGLPELHKALQVAEQRRRMSGRRTSRVVAETHPFNKAQQED